jgi:murein DD-endopeptidase MepM/ murein hydrolase activator NlpD
MKKALLLISLFLAGNVFASELPSNFSFTEDLELGDTGSEVKYLQIFLNNYTEYAVSDSGVGSSGHETEYFGLLTKQAVIDFQEAYYDDILAPWGFSNGTGMIGKTTRAKMNEILSEKEDVSVSSDKLYISTVNPSQGDTIVVKVLDTEENEVIVAEFLSKTYVLYDLGEEKTAFIGVNAKTTPGDYPIIFYSSINSPMVETVTVKNSNFPTTTLTVTTELEEEGYNPDSIQANVLSENQTLFTEALNDPIVDYYFNDEFVYPLDSISNVGAYGNIRCNSGVCLQHLGVDLDADEGTSVYSINSGVVKFARETTNYGKTIIVEHGGGIRSMYLHLSEFLVSEGQSVSSGQTIAYSGNTGYSIAPHLHLSINVYGYSINPLEFLEEVRKNF